MNFFCTKKHYEEWTKARGIGTRDAFCLDGRSALRVARELFGE